MVSHDIFKCYQEEYTNLSFTSNISNCSFMQVFFSRGVTLKHFHRMTGAVDPVIHIFLPVFLNTTYIITVVFPWYTCLFTCSPLLTCKYSGDRNKTSLFDGRGGG